MGSSSGSSSSGSGRPSRINLNKLHQTIHPCRCLIQLGRPGESDDDLGAGTVDFSPSDLDDSTDGNRFVAPEIQDPLQDEVGVQAGGRKAVA